MVSENQTKSRFIEPRLDLINSLIEKEGERHVEPTLLTKNNSSWQVSFNITQLCLDSLNLDSWKWNEENCSSTSHNQYGQNIRERKKENTLIIHFIYHDHSLLGIGLVWN